MPPEVDWVPEVVGGPAGSWLELLGLSRRSAISSGEPESGNSVSEGDFLLRPMVSKKNNEKFFWNLYERMINNFCQNGVDIF